MDILDKLKQVKMLIMDVDGVLTDCRIFLGSDGEWRRYFSIRDGVGIKKLKELGYKTAIITGSRAKDIRTRAEVLGVDFYFEGALDKIPSFNKLVETSGLKASEMAYIGDDFFDAPILDAVGFSATVPDAMEEAIESSDYITKRPAGNGAVREVCELIVKYGAFSDLGSESSGAIL